jgi:chemotaxis protein methyltransferase CheR
MLQLAEERDWMKKARENKDKHFTILRISDEEFGQFRDFIEVNIGIKFPAAKKSLIESRLSSHILKNGFENFHKYFQYLMQAGDSDELDYFVDKITTHTTHFFREDVHFDFLLGEGASIMKSLFRNQKIKILSLGSSTGEEMYTLAMVFHELRNKEIVMDYTIHAADISRYALMKAKQGRYKRDHLKSIPARYKSLFTVTDDHIEVKSELKRNLRFFILNATAESQVFPDVYHIVFCRNMLIYFSRPLQQNVIDNVSRYLVPKGMLYIGHSESLHNLKHSFVRIGPTIYQGVV